MQRSSFYLGWSSKALLFGAVTMLTVGGATFTRIFDWQDRTILWIIVSALVAIGLQGLADILQELEETRAVLREIRDQLNRT